MLFISVFQCSSILDNTSNSAMKTSNVSKVLLNAKETTLVITKSRSNNDDSNSQNKCAEEKVTISCEDKEKETSNDTIIDSASKCKTIPVINLASYNRAQTNKLSQSDHIAVSLQVNEIIDEAVKINEAKMNVEIDKYCQRQPRLIEEPNEINNNNDQGHQAEKKNENERFNFDQNRQLIQTSNTQDNFNIDRTEVPIQPVLSETRTFSFQEYSDHSLPTSTTSTLNTAETPSTGPESLITSDIEDGYKGNELEKKRKLEIAKRDSKEDFIESQFEFLKDHLDAKTNVDSDDEKSLEFSKRDIISSTMIIAKPMVARKAQPADKGDVINELTQIISCKRLDTFIKPNTDTNTDHITSKTSLLNNFQISTYSNGSSDNTKSKPINITYECTIQQCLNGGESNEQAISQNCSVATGDKMNCVEDEMSGAKSDETFIISKPVNRSVSFHSTSANASDIETNTINSDTTLDLSANPRSTSFVSLNGAIKYKENVAKAPTANQSTGSAQYKPTSELSIADIPSLQSIKVMKSILNNSNKMNADFKNIPNEENSSFGNKNVSSEIHSVSRQPNTENQKGAWKYQGPPSINFSTWGDRPKTTVNIKSDADYIFGGTSKIAALQKRFSRVETGNPKDAPVELTFTKSKEQCDNSICNLPIVRSVEYKKSVSPDENGTAVDTPDSSEQTTTFRYEIAHIVPESPSLMKRSKFLNNSTENNETKQVLPKSTHSTLSINSKTGSISRVQSFNDQSSTVLQLKSAKEAAKKEKERPIFTQFMLRKTGLKEKMFDKCVAENSKNSNECYNESKNISTTPKPPPTPAKPKIRPASINIQIDKRGQLLDSIRNFNRDTLKTNIIY